MKADEIQEAVQRLWLIAPEAELLGCLALALAETLNAVIEILESVNVAATTAGELTS